MDLMIIQQISPHCCNEVIYVI